jgi:1-acyl-sn-glycerol-3-phosphate acyltransferase
MADGDVYITGRIKDIVIRAGRHLYPQEIEEAVAGIPGIRKGGVAVFGVTDRASGTERVVILAETRETDIAARAALQVRVHEIATDIAGTPPDEILLPPPHTVPKTSSGKIRRAAAKELYVNGRTGPVQRALWWQMLRLALSAIGPQMRRIARLMREMLYAAWWWLVLAGAFLVGSIAVLVLPDIGWRWFALRCIGRITLAAMGVPIATTGMERAPSKGAILIFNHSSYTDSLVLAAVLRGEPAIVAKRELFAQFIPRVLLRRLGIPFVERYDVSASLADAQALVDLANEGRVLVFFPEGTFTRRAGLSGFYLGAFRVAAEANLPIFPGIIRGTRSLLRADQWFPQRTEVRVEICDPIIPSGKDFKSVLQLRDDARGVMLARCGEPDLQELVKPSAQH